jgi:2-hydroxy-3-oxopropionate reductase
MRIAVLGTGMMGGPMARRLCDAGHAVQVWNRTRAKAEPLAEQGAAVHDTARGAVAGAELVVTMLENGPVTESVLFDAADGVAAAMAPGALLVDMASIRPAEARERFASVPTLEFVEVEQGKHLWVGENQTFRVLTEIVERLNPSSLPLPQTWDGA